MLLTKFKCLYLFNSKLKSLSIQHIFLLLLVSPWHISFSILTTVKWKLKKKLIRHVCSIIIYSECTDLVIKKNKKQKKTHRYMPYSVYSYMYYWETLIPFFCSIIQDMVIFTHTSYIKEILKVWHIKNSLNSWSTI